MADRNIGKISPGDSGAPRRRSNRIRKSELRRPSAGGLIPRARETLAHPATVPVLAIAVVLSLLLTLTAAGGRWAAAPAAGRVADDTYAARVAFRLIDEQATEQRRDLSRATAERVYRLDDDILAHIERQLLGLPAAVASAGSYEAMNPDIVQLYGMTEPIYFALLGQSVDDEALQRWTNRVRNFIATLRERPLLQSTDIQDVRAAGNRLILLEPDGTMIAMIDPSRAINLDDVGQDLKGIAQRSGLYSELIEAVVNRVVRGGNATFTYDPAETERRIETPDEVFDEFATGDVIIARGETVTPRQLKLLAAEGDAHARSLGPGQRTASIAALWTVMAAFVTGLGGYLFFYNRRVVVRPWRSFSIALLVAIAQAAAVWVAVGSPEETWLGLTLPLTAVTMVVVTAYDRRMALVVAAAAVGAIGVSLSLSVAECVAIFAGCGVAAWRLGDIRSRGDVVRATVLVAATLALGVLAVHAVQRPAVPGVLGELPKDMIQAAVGGFVAGALTLFLMPTVERVFDVTTGMTLSELRDPKQPLLRTLQQRAAGTYNHSLNVATIAEAAAQAIGADALHLYVGCLYHDVGKLNKPDYFVENQPRGLNKHEKLSPAMSLLVIMGHVKDGLALAREHNLPRSLHHYIESHHGETLVTYFYHQAKQAAEGDDTIDAPEEIEYRYPGPKPRTKEAAILMLCDAVEGATRAMSEPTPSRIAALVHDIAMSRLHDGQFDESELTFVELSLIEEAVTKALCSIYHGRIAYPSQETKGATTGQQSEGERTRAAGA